MTNPFGVSTYRPDPIELARWTAEVARARRDYYERTTPSEPRIDYAALALRAERRRLARARKKAA